MTNIILCGGSGTRLFPLSREALPKQFVKLFTSENLSSGILFGSQGNKQGNKQDNNQASEPVLSLFELTLQRNAKLASKTLIVSNEAQYFLALEQLEEFLNTYPFASTPQYESLNPKTSNLKFSNSKTSNSTALNSKTLNSKIPNPKTLNSKLLNSTNPLNPGNYAFLLEPLSRNTAAAITLAALSVPKDEILLITPSDHLIKDTKAYEKAVSRACELASKNALVTFGITPSYAATGFGYIKAKGEQVLGFYEKPDLKRAQGFLKSKDYFWNSGMFCFKAGAFLKEMKAHCAPILKACESALKTALKDSQLTRIKHADMAKIESESIDYALFEKSKNIKIVPAKLGWSDVGSFDALYEEFGKDTAQNAISAPFCLLKSASKNLIINAGSPHKLIAGIGIDELIIVDTPDALLISKKHHANELKELVSELKAQKSELCKTHTTTHRPWGSYTVLEDERGYKIKRIEVKPGKRLSLQRHFHRNEHWIVLSGTASVQVGEQTLLVRPNESTYIKMGQTHRLSNEGKIPVVLIEAQVGEYTGEDDIERLEDDFKRI